MSDRPAAHAQREKPKAVVELAKYFSLSLSFSSLFLFLVAEEKADHSWFAKGKHKYTDQKLAAISSVCIRLMLARGD